jgi:DNA-binding PadR family transcriptional regulator
MVRHEDFLPTTTYAVLGLLNLGEELSGYEIRQWALQSLRFFYWTPAQSHIYRELRRLQDLGMVEGRDVAQADRPDKRAFAITEAGRAELERWLDGAPVAAPVLKYESALRLFFGHAARPERLVEVLDAHRAAVQRTLEELDAVRAMLAAGGPGADDAARWALADDVAAWGQAVWSADLDAVERLRGRLRGTAGS